MPIDAEAIARRFANRPGCRFVGFKAVGISVFILKLRTIVLEPRQVPPIEEFLLRYLEEGVSTPRDLTDLLGLTDRLVFRRLVDLRRNELIEVEGDEKTPRDQIVCRLTDRGREAVHMLHRNVIQEATLPNVVFHGLLRRPVQVGETARRQYWRPHEAKDQGLTLIRAIPNRAPRPDEIDVAALDRVTKRAYRPRPGEPARDCVAVRGVLKPIQTRYEGAVMIEYETLDSRRSRQVAFAVDGQLQDEYESAFVAARGPELLKDILTPASDTFEDRARRQMPSAVLHRIGPLSDIEALAAKAASARQEVEDKERELKEADRPDTREVLREELETALKRAQDAEAERDRRKAKYLWTPEIRSKLWEALTTCTDRLLILSGWISAEIVNDEFEDALRDALRRGVRVWLGYGFDKDNRRGQEQRDDPRWKAAERRLTAVQEHFPDKLVFKDIGYSHEKRLICDARFTFGGSFNFLSFSGEQRGRGKLRHEGADLIQDPEYCEELYKRYISQFFS